MLGARAITQASKRPRLRSATSSTEISANNQVMAPQKWGEIETKILLDHIQNEKGKDSLYLRDSKRAYQEAFDSIRKGAPDCYLTLDRVRSKVKSLFDRGSQEKYKSLRDFFLHGVCVLKQGYPNFERGQTKSTETSVRTRSQKTVPEVGQGHR